MKIITNDYGCGTSSAIFDYDDFDQSNVVVVNQHKHKHVFDLVDEDLLFIGHDFLSYLWSNEKYINHWKNYRGKKHVWCFEKIDCIIPAWRQKSHYSIAQCQKFTNSFFVSDEQDARKYNLKWLPQWASKKFYDLRNNPTTENRIVFSGQAQGTGYNVRDKLIHDLCSDPDVQNRFYVANKKRSKSWDDYVENFLNHKYILAPMGNFKGFNTRTYEALTSGRVLLQHVDDEFKWHINSLEKYKNVIFFRDFQDLKHQIIEKDLDSYLDLDPHRQYKENNLQSRLKLISG